MVDEDVVVDKLRYSNQYTDDPKQMRGMSKIEAETAPDQYSYCCPTHGGNMAKVDAKGRIVLPRDVRERLGITPGTVVEVREENGKAVVEPEDDPEEVLRRMEQMIEEFSAKDRDTRPFPDDFDPISEDFRENVRKGADDGTDE